MSPLVFLGVAAAVFVVVAAIALFVQRERRSSFESGIHRFQREMTVLAPDKPTRRAEPQDKD